MFVMLKQKTCLVWEIIFRWMNVFLVSSICPIQIHLLPFASLPPNYWPWKTDAHELFMDSLALSFLIGFAKGDLWQKLEKEVYWCPSLSSWGVSLSWSLPPQKVTAFLLLSHYIDCFHILVVTPWPWSKEVNSSHFIPLSLMFPHLCG